MWSQREHLNMVQRYDSYDSSQNISTDLAGVAPLSILQNLAVPKTSNKSTVLNAYGVLCGKKNCRLLTALDYVDFMRRKRWRVYQYRTLLKNSKMSHPRCVYINNKCGYQSITQQYLKKMFTFKFTSSFNKHLF